MTVFHTVSTKAVVALYEEQFVSNALYNFDIQAMATTFGS
jgi:hypothetical protein